MTTTIFNAGSGNWRATTTWKLGVVPTAADSVVLNFFKAAHPGASYQVNVDRTETAQDLTVLDHNILHLSANISPFGGTLNANQVLIRTAA
jgi:hypothetical protein